MHETVTSTELDNSHVPLVADHDAKFYYHWVAKVDDWDSHLTLELSSLEVTVSESCVFTIQNR